jgi:hypothetical protein
MRKLISGILLVLVFLSYSTMSIEFLNDEKVSDNYATIKSVIERLKRIITEDKKAPTKITKEIIDYIMSLERKDLINVAFAMEVYHRESKGQKGLIGGLHDYVFKISDDQIRNFVFKELEEHPEICEKITLVSIVNKEAHKTEELTKYEREFVMGDGIHEFLRSLNRRDLGRLAISIENYHRKQKDEFMFGGLHDYIEQISEEDLRTYVTKEVNEHLEINNVEALKTMLE